jgi:UDP-3-O-[3-hydroxymyristoyl] glucosamine N-acyltransferase
MRLDELAKMTDAEVVGDASRDVTGVNTLDDATEDQVSFLANPKYIKQLATTKAAAVFVPPKVSVDGVTLLRTKDVYYSWARAVAAIVGYRKHPHDGIHPKAHVEPSATIGEGTVVYPGAYIGPNTRIGRDCVIYPNAVIYNDCFLGDRVVVHAAAVIGCDGFGFATHQGTHTRIPQIGNVIIEDDVEIGPCCSIERASLRSTIIGKGTKMDGLVVIGHNSRIGEHGMIVAQVGIAGSTTLGHHVTLAGQVGINGHLKIGNNVTVGAQAGVISDVDDQLTIVGSPAMPASHARRVYSLFTQLPALLERIKRLEEQVEELAADEDELV